MQIFLRFDSITSNKFSIGCAHAYGHMRLSLLSNFLIFRHQYHSCIVCCYSCRCCWCFVRLHKSIKNYVRFCRNFVPTIVKMSTERQIAYYCHFSFLFFCLWVIQSCSNVNMLQFSFRNILLCCRITSSKLRIKIGWFFGNSIGSNFCPIKKSTNWLCLCLTNQLNRIYLTMTCYFSCFFLYFVVHWNQQHQH